MANYQYDEGGSMAAYFLVTFLSLVLIPLTISLRPLPQSETESESCQCSLCIQHRNALHKKTRRSLLNPRIGVKATFVTFGWILFSFLVYRIMNTRADNKVYDPFEILGISASTSVKDIKSHYKKLSRQFHPDKVKLAANQTIEAVEAYFVELTKAYKSLTDETIRRNWELYGHPDGRQEVSMGIAIPKWVVEGNNKFVVLVGYCAVIGGLLPFIVGKWWFGNKIKTKDGVLAKTAEIFFKNIKEDSAMNDVINCLGKAPVAEFPKISPLSDLEDTVRSNLGTKYQGPPFQTLLYAHLFRIPIKDINLQRAQEAVLLRTSTLLNSLLNISTSRNWLNPTLHIMRLHAYLAQAIPPSSPKPVLLSQFSNISFEDAKSTAEQLGSPDLKSYISFLRQSNHPNTKDAIKTAEHWGRLELVEASFKVIGERIITPLSIVQLLVKARISPPALDETDQSDAKHKDSGKSAEKENEEKDTAFLSTRRDVEDVSDEFRGISWAHAPYWPVNRKPSWWILIADSKSNRVVMPPTKITDVPLSNPSKERNFRAYKIQFQAPQTAAIFSWKIHIVSDTFVGEEVVQDLILRVDDVSQLTTDEQGVDDDISDPEEDSLAGQMAAMRGGAVKKSKVHEEDSEEESSTDDDSDSSSSSDSD